MARDNENDVTDGATALESEGRIARRNGKEVYVPGTEDARRRAIPDAPISADALADAIAKAHIRAREDEGKAKVKPLPETVRASVRAGTETKLVNDAAGKRYVTSPISVTFKASETADGREAIVPHGRPVRLKREAFLRYEADGKVIIAQ